MTKPASDEAAIDWIQGEYPEDAAVLAPDGIRIRNPERERAFLAGASYGRKAEREKIGQAFIKFFLDRMGKELTPEDWGEFVKIMETP